jgi:hypothetical protein
MVTTDYAEQYKKMHEDPELFQGISTQVHIKDIEIMVHQYKAKSLLDYGCGKGDQYHVAKLHMKHFDGVMPELYDIGVEKYNKIPSGKFDGVICTDVMEHVPEDKIDEVLKQIYSKAKKFVFFGICDQLAVKLLPNGENAHCTVKPMEWWREKIQQHATVPTNIKTYGKKDARSSIEG